MRKLCISNDRNWVIFRSVQRLNHDYVSFKIAGKNIGKKPEKGKHSSMMFEFKWIKISLFLTVGLQFAGKGTYNLQKALRQLFPQSGSFCDVFCSFINTY